MADAVTTLFISYAHADSPFVDRLQADLGQQGFATWVDRRGLAGGQHWRRELQEAIDRADVLLVVLSPEAVASLYVQNEYGYATEEGKLVIPLYYRPCKVPLELRGTQWIDFQHSYEQGFDALVDALQRHQQRRATPGSSAPFSPSPIEERIAAKAEPMWKVPSTFTSLIGREQEVAEISALLKEPEVRLLTLLGPGGIGKTRLSIAVATHLRPSFEGGICFVPLAAIRDPELVLPTIAQELGLKESGTAQLLQQLQSFVGEQSFLLVLDNLEQVVAAAPEFEALLAGCPHLKMLVTSRAVLHLSAEQVLPVAPLALPSLSQDVSTEGIAQTAAVALFVQRARSVLPNFQLTAANARAIAEVCVRLDGLPLAIELAAARVKLLPPQALLSRLSQRLQVLTGGLRSLPARQQTLRSTIQWSYDLLGPEEQVLFRLLSVFVGGWTLEAAETLCQHTRKADLDVLNTLSVLLDNSLIQPSEQEDEEPRFLMLQTIREFGLERLTESGEREATQAAHARYFLALAEQAEAELVGPKQVTWIGLLEQEHDNLRAALEWALQEASDEALAVRQEVGLRLSTTLEAFWVIRGYLREARLFLERALVRSEMASSSLRAQVLLATTDIIQSQGDLDQAELLGEQSLALYRELNDTHGIAQCLNLLAELAWTRGKMTEARALHEEQLRLIRQVGEPREVAEALFTLANVVCALGEYTRGQALFEEALVLFHKAGNELMIGATLVQSAFWLWFTLGDVATIHQRLREGQTFIRKVGDWSFIAVCSWLAALVALREGDTVRANDQALESVAIYQEVESRWLMAWALHVLGRVEAQRGELRAAHQHYKESLLLSRELGEKWIIPFNLQGLASLVAVQGELKWAVQLWGAAEALREAMASPLPPADHADYEQAVATARAHLGEEAFTAGWQEGRTMPLEQVIEEALKREDEIGKS